jgi:hypothetical protein
MEKYTLMNKNKEVLYFDLNADYLLIDNVVIKNKTWSPVSEKSRLKEQRFLRWLNNRCIPNSRYGIDRLRKEYNIEDPKELMLAKYGLSLSDHYWIKKRNEIIDWNDINYFDHRYSENMGKIFFDRRFRKLADDFNSPDSALNGSYKKRWCFHKQTGMSYLLKGGDGIGQEPFNEAFCSELLKEFNIDHVPYKLKVSGDTAVSICPNIIDKSTELVSAGNIIEKFELKKTYEDYIRICKKNGLTGIEDDMDKMLAFDLLIANTDRHWYNFGIIRNAGSGEWLKPIPVFDNGSSLWHAELKFSGKEKSHSSFNGDTNETAIGYVKNKEVLGNKKLDLIVAIFDKSFKRFNNEDRKKKLRKELINHIEYYRKVMKLSP